MNASEDLKHAARRIAAELYRWIVKGERRVLLVGGESGAGKSVVATELAEHLRPALVVAMDDYYHLPPAQNDVARARDLDRVGPGEIDTDRITALAREFRAGATQLRLRRLAEDRRRFEEREEKIDARVMVIEGTFALSLDIDDCKRVLIDRDHESTEAGRRARGRDVIDELTPRVLAIEHEIVRASASAAHYVIGPELPLVTVNEW